MSPKPDDIVTICARLESLMAQASEGPWFQTGAPWFADDTGVLSGSPDGNIAHMIADCDDGMAPRDEYEGPFRLGSPAADAALIVEMRNAVPKLIAVIRELAAKDLRRYDEAAAIAQGRKQWRCVKARELAAKSEPSV